MGVAAGTLHGVQGGKGPVQLYSALLVVWEAKVEALLKERCICPKRCLT